MILVVNWRAIMDKEDYGEDNVGHNEPVCVCELWGYDIVVVGLDCEWSRRKGWTVYMNKNNRCMGHSAIEDPTHPYITH